MYDEMINSNIGLLHKQLHKLHVAGNPDAISLGYEALYNACKTFDITKGVAFSTYATVCIYNALGTYIRSLHKKKRIVTVSYNAFINEEQEFGQVVISDTILEDKQLKKELHDKINEALVSLDKELTNATYRMILKAWKDSAFESSTVDIARKVGVSQSYVSQALNVLKFRLRRKLEGYYYD